MPAVARLVDIQPTLSLFEPRCTVYLIHLARPISRAQHYIGSTEDFDRRMREHQRKWPLYRLEQGSFDALTAIMPGTMLAQLVDLEGRNFRRKHTFLQAVHTRIDCRSFDIALLKAARRHSSNGLIMAANQRGIPWTVARIWQADRAFEFRLKRQKNARQYCPVCHGTPGIFDEAPF
jgi:hypothetical protein